MPERSNSVAGEWRALTMEKDKLDQTFNHSLYEMGVNTGVVLALVFALSLSLGALF